MIDKEDYFYNKLMNELKQCYEDYCGSTKASWLVKDLSIETQFFIKKIIELQKEIFYLKSKEARFK